MMNLIIREFSQYDIESVVALWNIVFSNDPPWNDPRQIIERKCQHHDDLFLVGEYNKKIISTVMGGYDGFRGWIYHLAVLPEYRMSGYAKLMMNQIEKRLRFKGCIKINLQIRSNNQDTINFYHKIGYQIEDHTSMGKLLLPDENI